MTFQPRVAFFSPLWARKGPLRFGWSDYWRLAVPAVELHRNGWDVVFARSVLPADDGRLVFQDPDGQWFGDRDVAVFHRWMSATAPDLIRGAVQAGQFVINDLDDWFWGLPQDHPALEATDPDQHPDYNRDNYRRSLEVSSLITTATPWLSEAVGDWGPPVRTVENYIDLSAWPASTPGHYVGWVGATAGRSSDLAILRDEVVPWLRDHERPFYHGGAIPGEVPIREVLGYGNVFVRGVQGILEYPRLWEPMRIALIPLGMDDFSRAKSWVKALEACARGIPFIASDHAEYRALGVGMIAEKTGDWATHLDALEDPRFYAAEAARNRAKAEELAIADRWTKWNALLRDGSVLDTIVRRFLVHPVPAF